MHTSCPAGSSSACCGTPTPPICEKECEQKGPPPEWMSGEESNQD